MSELSTEEVSQFVSFRLGDEIFAVEVNQVREILELSPITLVPTAEPHLQGLVNVRGRVVPVADMGLVFGLGACKCGEDTRILVMELPREAGAVTIGCLTDEVLDVVSLSREMTMPPPKIAMRWRSEWIRAVAEVNDRFVIILDMDAVFLGDNLKSINEKEQLGPEMAAAGV